jgi:hypothetical protein
MTVGKFVRSVTVGFLLAVFAIGLLPFLFVYNFTEVTGLTDLDTSPLILFIGKFIDGSNGGHDSKH